jgi:hypothetical protein
MFFGLRLLPLPSEFGAGVRVSWNLEFGIVLLVSAGLKRPKGNLVVFFQVKKRPLEKLWPFGRV